MVTLNWYERMENKRYARRYVPAGNGLGTLASPYYGFETALRNDLPATGIATVLFSNEVYQVNTGDVVNNPATYLFQRSNMRVGADGEATIVAGSNYGDGTLKFMGTQGAPLTNIGVWNIHTIGANLPLYNPAGGSDRHQQGIVYEYVNDSWMRDCYGEQFGDSTGTHNGHNSEGVAFHIHSGCLRINLRNIRATTSKISGIDWEPNVNSSDINRNSSMSDCTTWNNYHYGLHVSSSDGYCDHLTVTNHNSYGNAHGIGTECENVPTDNQRLNNITFVNCHCPYNFRQGTPTAEGGYGWAIWGGNHLKFIGCTADYNTGVGGGDYGTGSGFDFRTYNAGGDLQNIDLILEDWSAIGNGGSGLTIETNGETDALQDFQVGKGYAGNNTGYGAYFIGTTINSLPRFRFRHVKGGSTNGQGFTNNPTFGNTWVSDPASLASD